jgi:hypothetical protein
MRKNIGRTWSACSLTVAYVMLLFSGSATSQGGREAPGIAQVRSLTP